MYEIILLNVIICMYPIINCLCIPFIKFKILIKQRKCKSFDRKSLNF